MTKVSNLPVAQTANDADLYMVAQSAQSRKQTLAQLRAAIGANTVALNSLTGVADKLAYFTGVGAMALTDLTPLARNLLDDTTQAAMQTTLGLVKTTGQSDNTAGRMLQVGAFGWNGGAAISQANTVNADTLTVAALYSFPNGGVSLPNNAQAWYVRVSVHGSLYWQEARGMTATNQDSIYSRVWTGAAWSNWILIATAGTNSTITSLTGLASITSAVAMSLPTRPAQYTLATLPSAATYNGYLIDVTNATGGPKICRSNGTVWQILNTTTTVS